MVPHVAARKTHQRLLKFSFVTPKRLLQQNRPIPEVAALTRSLRRRVAEVATAHQGRVPSVLRFINNSNLVGCSTGKSAGAAPLRILSTKSRPAGRDHLDRARSSSADPPARTASRLSLPAGDA